MFSLYFELKAALRLCFLPQAYGCIRTTQSYWRKRLAGNLVIYLKLNGSIQEMNALWV